MFSRHLIAVAFLTLINCANIFNYQRLCPELASNHDPVQAVEINDVNDFGTVYPVITYTAVPEVEAVAIEDHTIDSSFVRLRPGFHAVAVATSEDQYNRYLDLLNDDLTRQEVGCVPALATDHPANLPVAGFLTHFLFSLSTCQCLMENGVDVCDRRGEFSPPRALGIDRSNSEVEYVLNDPSMPTFWRQLP